jgi:8-oxo-dGTP pyrophosphatase MutT (NUDIX family)
MTLALPDWLQELADALSELGPARLSPTFPEPPPDALPAAVLMLFSEGGEGPQLLLTERAAHMRQHARQISFPGGRSDPGDHDLVSTALREASEEVGVEPDTVEVFGQLPRIWLPPSNHAVTAVLGYWRQARPLVAKSPDEVANVLQVPISRLADPALRYTVVHPSGYRGPAFDIGADVLLWGFTGGIVARLIDEVGWAEPWDASREISWDSIQ